MKNAFTMIELIFVIVILGILASVALPKYENIQNDAKIAYEKNVIGALRSTLGAIHAKSEMKNGDFIAYTDSPTGVGRASIKIEVTKTKYPISVSSENTKNADGTYHLTENEEFEKENGINGSVLAVIMTYSSRDNFSTGKTFTADGTEARCDKTVNECKQLIEGPATKKTGIPGSEKGFLQYVSNGAWVYDAISGVIAYIPNKKDGSNLNIVDNTSPDF